MIRKDWNDQIFRTEKEKQDAIISKVKMLNSKGHPLLIFTSSVDKSEIYSDLFKKNKITHTVLNAKNHEKEAEIIANAGKLNSVIITTSISGRGVDIKLGGLNQSEKDDVKKRGGLFVIGTERMESRRVDNQARGRSGRQGDEGSSIFFVSLEDDLMRLFGSETMNSMLEKLGLKDGESIDHPWINKAMERAQQKVEARNFDIRKTLIKFDNVLNDQRHVIFDQRKNVIDGKEDENYSDIFLEEVLDNLKRQKILHEKSPNSKEFPKALKQTLGKSITDDELGEILNSDLKSMEKKINYLENRKESYKTSSNVFISFKYAFNGISYVLKTSRNFKIQLIFAVTSLIIGFLLKISLSNYVILIATIMSVLILEILNTSIESIVDLVVKKEFSTLAKISKDTSAGAVLLASINSVIIAVYIFVPKIKLLF